jgi:V4R domain
MTLSGSIDYYYPNKMGRIILQALEETLGSSAAADVLLQAHLPHLAGILPPNNLERNFSFDHIGKIQHSLDDLYGPRGGRGLAVRSGRTCFKYGLREFGPLLGLTDSAFRLLPLRDKLKAGAGLFAEAFNRFSDQRVRLEEDEKHIYWHIERCPVCWGRTTAEPVCHLAVGILEEALYWVSCGRQFSVAETRCIARGDPTCTIQIEKQPYD